MEPVYVCDTMIGMGRTYRT